MTTTSGNPPDYLHCHRCGGLGVTGNGSVRWDGANQKWEVADLGDDYWCCDCDGDECAVWCFTLQLNLFEWVDDDLSEGWYEEYYTKEFDNDEWQQE